MLLQHISGAVFRMAVALLLLPLLPAQAAVFAADGILLKVSYDPARELYREFDRAFARHWAAKTGDTVTMRQSHGGSGQRRS